MKSKVSVIASEYSGEATISYENNQLIFSVKPAWAAIVAVPFGMIGYSLVPEKEKFRLDISEVETLRIDKKNYLLTTNMHKSYQIKFKKEDELSIRLKNDLINKLI